MILSQGKAPLIRVMQLNLLYFCGICPRNTCILKCVSIFACLFQASLGELAALGKFERLLFKMLHGIFYF